MKSFVIIVMLLLVPLAASGACDMKPQDYTGEITFEDSSKTKYNWFWIVPGGDRLPYSEDMMDLQESVKNLSYVRLPSVSNIDFLDFTHSEKSLIDSLKFCPDMRKAKVNFADGAILEKVYLDCADAIWVSDSKSGKLNDNKIKSITFDLKELKKCQHCSKQYRAVDWKYCPYCGKPLD